MVKTKKTTIEYIAEIGLNHNGSMELAKQHIDSAISSGATIAKFQTYFTETRPYKNPSLEKILKNCELKANEFKELKDYCTSAGIQFASSPFCLRSVDVLDEIGCEIYKVPSFHLTNFQLISHILGKKSCQTLIISTGLSSMNEILELDKHLQLLPIEKVKIVLLHCISQYPIKSFNDLNLINIETLKSLESCDFVGLSDHSIGVEAASFSIMLGSTFIEKHFTIDTSLPGADHQMSANPLVFTDMVSMCENAKNSLGTTRDHSFYEVEADCLQFKKSSTIS